MKLPAQTGHVRANPHAQQYRRTSSTRRFRAVAFSYHRGAHASGFFNREERKGGNQRAGKAIGRLDAPGPEASLLKLKKFGRRSFSSSFEPVVTGSKGHRKTLSPHATPATAAPIFPALQPAYCRHVYPGRTSDGLSYRQF